jgi:cytoskeletal protein RodZ
VSIERAAEETRIRPDFLMRMESDEFDFLAPTYVRGFLRSYARYLHADPEPLMTEFDARFGGGRVDTAQIAALEQHGKRQFNVPGRGISSWKLAAGVTGGVLVLLALVGILNNPSKDNPPVAGGTPAVEATPSAEPSVEPSESVTPIESPSDDGVIAFDNGINLVINASKGDCWISVQEDGQDVTNGSGGRLMAQGETAHFQADQRLQLRLGLPSSVVLVVNGHNIGSPGGTDAIDITLPDDIDSFVGT